MRESNHTFPQQNRACVCITSALYDRRALDSTAALPLLNSLTHLTYLTSTSPRIREILTLDGGLERLLHILRNSCIPRPPPPPPDLYGLSLSVPASTGLLTPDRAIAYRFSLAFQCVSNVGVRGSEQIRTRVVQAGVLDVVAQVLEVWLRSRGLSIEAGPLGQPGGLGGSHGRAGDPSVPRASRRRGINFAVPHPAIHQEQQQVVVPASSSAEGGGGGGESAPRPRVDGPPMEPPTQTDLTISPANGLRQPSEAIAPSSSSSTSLPVSASLETTSAPDSVPTSGDEGPEMNDGESGTGQDDGDDQQMMDVDVEAVLAVTDAETGRLAQLATEALQNMAGGGTPFGAITRNHNNPFGIMAEVDPTPRAGHSYLPVLNLPAASAAISASAAASASASSSSSIRPRRPSMSRSSSASSSNIDDTRGAITSSSSSSSPAVQSNTRLDSRSPRALLIPNEGSGQVSATSSPGGSNVSTPMGTPTGGGGRDRSGTLTGRPAPPMRRRRRDPGHTDGEGNESGTTGGEDDEALEEGGGGGRQGGAGGAAGGGGARNEPNGDSLVGTEDDVSPPMNAEVEIVQDEDTATGIEPELGDGVENNVDMQMGAPPGAPGAAETPRTGADVTPRQPFVPLTQNDATTPATGGAPGPRGLAALADATVRITRPAVGGGPGFDFADPGAVTAPPTVALATAQATQRTLRDLSLEGNMMTPSETTYRDDDILLSLQLLAYLSKYPHVRQAFHRPRDPFHPNVALEPMGTEPGTVVLISHVAKRPQLSTTPNIFSLVERFTFRPSPTDPTVPQLPEEIVYWAGVIMRNACRKDESRGGIRQCANMTCGKWEASPRQFAKCRRCRKAKYCSKECQSKAWSEGHRFWCSQRGENESGENSGTPPVQPVPEPPVSQNGEPIHPARHHHHQHHAHRAMLAAAAAAGTPPRGGAGVRPTVDASHGTQTPPVPPPAPAPAPRQPVIRNANPWAPRSTAALRAVNVPEYSPGPGRAGRNILIRHVTPPGSSAPGHDTVIVSGGSMDVDPQAAGPSRSPNPRRTSFWGSSNSHHGSSSNSNSNNPNLGNPNDANAPPTLTPGSATVLAARAAARGSGSGSGGSSRDRSGGSGSGGGSSSNSGNRASILPQAGGAFARALGFAGTRLGLGGQGGDGGGDGGAGGGSGSEGGGRGVRNFFGRERLTSSGGRRDGSGDAEMDD